MYNLVMRFLCINQSQKIKEKLKKKGLWEFCIMNLFPLKAEITSVLQKVIKI